MNAKIITLDGPAAAGKSTVARALSRRLNFLYVDSGALYRIVTWQALQQGVATDDDEALKCLIERIQVDFSVREGAVSYVVGGMIPADEIRTPELNRHVSPVSKVPEVRIRVTDWLRELRSLGDLVVEGRDIGTVVFPESPARFYLDANTEERARRRQAEDHSKGFAQDTKAVLSSILNRDRIDSTRKSAPLKIPEGAVVIDTTPLSVEQVVATILSQLPASYLAGPTA